MTDQRITELERERDEARASEDAMRAQLVERNADVTELREEVERDKHILTGPLKDEIARLSAMLKSRIEALARAEAEAAALTSALSKAVDDLADAADRLFKIGRSVTEAMGPEFEEPASQIFVAAGIVRQYEAEARQALASTDAGAALLAERERYREALRKIAAASVPERNADVMLAGCIGEARAALSGTRAEGEG